MAACMLLDALAPQLLFGAPPLSCRGGLFRRASRDARVSVREVGTKGWLLRGSLPGKTPADVTVELAPGGEGAPATITIHALPLLERSFTLPAEAQLDRVRASLRDGVLRVAVPRADAAPLVLPVADGPLEGAPEAETLSLNVPGFGASSLALTADTARGRLRVEGRRGETVAFTRELALHEDVDVGAVRAAAQHGLLKLHLPRSQPAPPKPIALSCSPGAASEPAGNEHVLARIAVPGIKPQSIHLNLDQQRRLITVRCDDDGSDEASMMMRMEQEWCVHVPTGVALASVRATAVDGLLKIFGQEVEQPAAIAVPLATDKDATLNDSDDTAHDQHAADDQQQQQQQQQAAEGGAPAAAAGPSSTLQEFVVVDDEQQQEQQ